RSTPPPQAGRDWARSASTSPKPAGVPVEPVRDAGPPSGGDAGAPAGAEPPVAGRSGAVAHPSARESARTTRTVAGPLTGEEPTAPADRRRSGAAPAP